MDALWLHAVTNKEYIPAPSRPQRPIVLFCSEWERYRLRDLGSPGEPLRIETVNAHAAVYLPIPLHARFGLSFCLHRCFIVILEIVYEPLVRPSR